MHEDHIEYFQFTGRSRLEKSINSLLGIVEGIAIDSAINSLEHGYLNSWLQEHEELQNRHPFNELYPVVAQAMEDQIITESEKLDLLWLCERLRSSNFFDGATVDLQRLHAILGGIAADGVIAERELDGLADWLAAHENLKTLWPYEEVYSLIVGVLSDRRIDNREHKMLLSFFSEFVALLDDRTITDPLVSDSGSIVGLCAVCPDIAIAGSTFCFTGASSRYSRSKFEQVVNELGGKTVSNVSKKVEYLVIGSNGNPCWAYACYGRKVESAVSLRKKGVPLLLIHEHDFHDAIADMAGV